ncbi:prostatic acid phosphatase-like [Tiliqua scincoides]|uniref:prostatic acid phosphatase-like n=1 Tax=Tiliqua scincoides TaxID=71010 RepID=UPI0034618C97
MNMAVISPVCSFHRFGFSFLSLFCALLLQSTTGRQLKFVLLVMQHGDRTPLDTYPTDPYKEDNWPQGFGQLTTVGLQQHYQLGQLLKERYKLLLSEEYRREEIYIRSTDTDENIMSAQANLAGLFQPTEKQSWNKNIPWQPVPVHTVPVKDDQKTHGYKLPEWVTTETLEQLEEMLKDRLTAIFGIHKREEKSRLQGGVLVKDILKKIIKATQCSRQAKMIMYSVYDVTLFALLMALNVFETTLPRYAACYFFELYEESKGQKISQLVSYLGCHKNSNYTIEMHYRDSHEKEQPTQVILPGCTVACPLKTFKRLVSPIIPNNWEEECNK